jgi:hypothetical protein
MQWLAAFIMRGRSAAALVAAASGVLFWLFPPFLIIAGAVIALVTLRRGAVEGAFVVVLGGLAAAGYAWLALRTPLPILRVLLICWIPVWLLALVLRNTVSLSRTLQAAAFLGVFGVVSLYLSLGDPLPWWAHILEQFHQNLVSGIIPRQTPDYYVALEQLIDLLKEWAPYLIGQLVSVSLLFIFAALLLGRWWQALLFNQGGFRTEFQELRLGCPLAICTIALFGLAVISTWMPLSNIVLVLGILYTVQGIALVHSMLFKLRISNVWFVLFYLLLIPILSQFVMVLGLVDAWVDFRNLIQKRLDKR